MSTTVFILGFATLLICATIIVKAAWKERNNTYRKYLQTDSLLNQLRKTEAPKERVRREELVEA